MTLRLVKAEERYREAIVDFLDEWQKSGEKITPYAVTKGDVHDFPAYCEAIELKEPKDGLVPDSTFFCLEEESGQIVGAVNIRHYLNDYLRMYGGHIGDGVRPSRRNEGIATKMIALALEECKKLGIDRVLMTCDRDNIASARSIQKNGGVLENEVNDGEEILQRYWIDLHEKG